MGKKLNKKKNVSNSEVKVTVEIDYIKLAEALNNLNKKEMNHINKKSIRIKVMNFFNGITYIFLSLICCYKIFDIWYSSSDDIINNIIYTVFFMIFAIAFFLSEQESFSDDNESIQHFFNINIGVVAVVLAWITLLK